MDLVYYDIFQNKQLEGYVNAYGDFLRSRGERPVTVTRCANVEEVLRTADVVSLHTVRPGARARAGAEQGRPASPPRGAPRSTRL